MGQSNKSPILTNELVNEHFSKVYETNKCFKLKYFGNQRNSIGNAAIDNDSQMKTSKMEKNMIVENSLHEEMVQQTMENSRSVSVLHGRSKSVATDYNTG